MGAVSGNCFCKYEALRITENKQQFNTDDMLHQTPIAFFPFVMHIYNIKEIAN